MTFLHRLGELFAVSDYPGLYHLAQQVVALAGTLAHSGEDRESVMFLCNIVDKLFDEHGLAHARATKQADLSALEVRLEQVDDLDAGVEDFLGGGQVLELRWLAVDRERVGVVERAETVDGVPGHIHNAAPDLTTHGHRDGTTRRDDLQSPFEAVRGVHRDAPDGIFADVLLHLDYEGAAARSGQFEGIVDVRKYGSSLAVVDVEMNIYNRADDLGYLTFDFRHCLDY